MTVPTGQRRLHGHGAHTDRPGELVRFVHRTSRHRRPRPPRPRPRPSRRPRPRPPSRRTTTTTPFQRDHDDCPGFIDRRRRRRPPFPRSLHGRRPVPVAAFSAKRVDGAARVGHDTAVRCAVAACRGKVTLLEKVTTTVRSKRGTLTKTSTVTVGSLSYTTRTGRTVSLTIHLNARGMKDLAASDHGRLAVTESLSVVGGTTKTRR